jgi:hypothetical protein
MGKKKARRKCMLKRLTLLSAGIVLGGAALTACGNNQGYVEDVAYTPPAYGVNGQCYYVNDPLEVVAMQNAGLCPRTWHPVIMPLWWHSMYAPYYDSYGYYGRFPSSYQRSYVTVVHKWESQHKSDMNRFGGQAKWKGSNGKTFSGSVVQKELKSGKASFGGGNMRSKGFGNTLVKKNSVNSNSGNSNSGNSWNKSRSGSDRGFGNGNRSRSNNSFGSGSRSRSGGGSFSGGGGRRH